MNLLRSFRMAVYGVGVASMVAAQAPAPVRLYVVSESGDIVTQLAWDGTALKVNHTGTYVYITCMNSDEVLEIDRQSIGIVRRHATGQGVGAGHATAGQGPAGRDCSPTFVSLSADDTRLYVACNHANTVQVLDVPSFTLVKEIPTGAGAYNVEPSPDGKWVIVTNKKAQNISIIGTDPGAVDVIDLQGRTRVATTPVPLQPTGIAVVRRP